MIDLKAVSVKLGQKTLLRCDSLRFTSGRVNVIAGRNGSGKSTLLRLIAGIQNGAEVGEFTIDGSSIKDMSLRQRAQLISWLPQVNAVAFDYAAIDVVVMGRYPWHQGAPGKGDFQRAEEVLSELGFSSHSSAPMSILSGGERQKVLIARALVGDHKYLVLDEPNVYLDQPTLHQLMDCLAARTRKGQTVIVSLHDLTLAAKYADNITLIRQGMVVASGEPEQIMTSKLLSQTFDSPIQVFPQNSGTPHIEFVSQNQF